MGQGPGPGAGPADGGRGLRVGRELATLAGLYGVQTAYVDASGRRRTASGEAVTAVLRALGVPVEGPGDVGGQIVARRRALEQRLMDPVLVAWDGTVRPVRLRLQAGEAGRPVRARLRTEDGGVETWEGGPNASVSVPAPLPPGYHRLEVETAGRTAAATVISAPRRVGAPDRRDWGVLVPVYGLRSRRDWGVGDLTDLEAVMRWIGSLGGGVVGTLPLLAAFLDEPFQPVPYSPASRLFWNELYLDPERLPELESSAEAREAARLADPEIKALRRRRLVDYRKAMAIKRPVIEALAREVAARPSSRREALEAFVASRPELRRYAMFRAAGERFRETWQRWPAGPRNGTVRARDVDPDAVRYHLYAQWAMHEQLGRVAGAGPDLYLDLPLGVDPAGFDVWRWPETFARSVSTGSPPDDFSPSGQDWGFPPPRPDRIRTDGYRYLRDCVTHLLTHARVLRIDHVMSLHRLFWIPRGMEATEGVYVRYRPNELYAVLLLEAYRRSAEVVGEDLGTVPAEVRRAMDARGVRRSFVIQTEVRPGRSDPIPPQPAGSVAGLNTHDMPTFAAFWAGRDIDEREQEGAIDAAGAGRERRARERLRRATVAQLRRRGLLRGRAETREVLAACLALMAEGPCGIVLPALEDLWLAPQAQNRPGSRPAGHNWRRKLRHPVERARSMREVVGTLRFVDHRRRETSLR